MNVADELQSHPIDAASYVNSPTFLKSHDSHKSFLEEADEFYFSLKNAANAEKLTLILYADDLWKLDRLTLYLSMREYPKFYRKIAVVASLWEEVILKMRMKEWRHTVPLRFFRKEKEAAIWLRAD